MGRFLSASSSSVVPRQMRSRAPRRWVLGIWMGFVLAIVLGSVLAIVHLQSGAHAAQRHEIAELKLSRSVQQLKGIEWQAAAQGRLDAQNRRTADQLIGGLDGLARTGAEGAAASDRLDGLADRYRDAVRAEFAYLKAGNRVLAHHVDATRSDPAADALVDRVNNLTTAAERTASQRSRSATRLTVLIAVLGAIGTLLLLWRLEKGLESARRVKVLSETAATLGEQASHDMLTGPPNRRKLLLDLKTALTERRPVALALIDLDGFKSYNDMFGHTNGDLLLERFGHELARAVTGGSVYRLGGDEFCALLPDDETLPRAMDAVQDALEDEGDSFVVTASYGVVHLPAEAENETEALSIADKRMYQHKGSGRASAANQTTDLARSVIEAHDLGLHQHAESVATMAEAIGRELGLTNPELVDLRRVAELHDIGKVGIPRTILDRPGELDDRDWHFIRQHTIIGEGILASASALGPVARAVRSTHERYDGTGYPDQLSGDEIPLLSRIVFVCDTWDAMTRDRSYRPAFTTEQARAELERCAGTQFDPTIVSAALTVIDHRTEGHQPPKSASSGAGYPANVAKVQ
jgi:diguanylate cyclase (GGDEF)-like protein